MEEEKNILVLLGKEPRFPGRPASRCIEQAAPVTSKILFKSSVVRYIKNTFKSNVPVDAVKA
jgi:hypothetical protein